MKLLFYLINRALFERGCKEGFTKGVLLSKRFTQCFMNLGGTREPDVTATRSTDAHRVRDCYQFAVNLVRVLLAGSEPRHEQNHNWLTTESFRKSRGLVTQSKKQ